MTTKRATLHANGWFQIGRTDDRLWSSFTEHLGRCIYGGLYDPDSPHSDDLGFRTDVQDAVRGLGLGLVRYPGGNFVSNYDWKDGIGPVSDRPRRMDFAWSSIESNRFGVDEFLQWAERTGVEPMLAVNLGTGTIKDAAELVEYCNHPGGTYWSDLRRANGREEPYNVTYWCLGNEMEGSWQAGHMSAAEYAGKAREAAKMMRWVDKDIKLIACGSSYHMLPEYLDWDRIVLGELYPYVDFVSTHYYTMNSGQGDSAFLASYADLDRHIKNAAAAVDFVRAKNEDCPPIPICLDEWNVWNFQDIKMDSLDDLLGKTTFEMTSAQPWEEAPAILQEQYSLLDALTFGGLGITILNNVDTVAISCLAQLVNVIAPITTDPVKGLLKQTTYYPLEQLTTRGRGTVIQTVVDGDTYTVGDQQLPIVHAAVVLGDDDTITVFALNCDLSESTELELDFSSLGTIHLREHRTITGDDLSVRNTWDEPDAIGTTALTPSTGNRVTLPAASWNILTFDRDGALT
ncbi:alpha-L-arabinofuranosidase AbfA [Microbacterium kribbense]|uniref:non-reducing end alpha-L-arabinofuranosidase n=1 Tax=Microbacterium kribbense TaxID=433645 RepID=A0ABP7GXC6_9MICO